MSAKRPARGSKTASDLLEERIDYRFSDQKLLERALTHGSFNEGRPHTVDYQRLEFLGDRVLGLLAAERLFADHAKLDEGGLAIRLNALVRKEACARAARRMELGGALRMSLAEDAAGGRDKTRILGDACEALLGALYVDGGLEAAAAVFERFWADEFERKNSGERDPKTRLQEWAQSRGLPAPKYKVIAQTGPDHRPSFVIEATINGLAPQRGEGGSRRTAERAAAHALLQREAVDD